MSRQNSVQRGGSNRTANGPNSIVTKPQDPVTINFQVHLKSDLTPPNSSSNSIYVVGGDTCMGAWNPSKAIEMSRMAGTGSHNKDGMTWSVEVIFTGPSPIQYRYFIGRPSPTVPNMMIIHKWEAFVSPRTFIIKSLPTKAPTKHSAASIQTRATQDSFGLLAQHSEIDVGWLTTQMEVRLSFLKNPIHWWNARHRTQRYSMNISAADPKDSQEPTLDMSASMSSLQDYAMLNEEHVGILGPVKYTALTETKKGKDTSSNQTSDRNANKKGYYNQGQFGVDLSTDENLIFKVQTEDPQNLYFTIDFFVWDHPKATENAPYFTGTSHILYGNFKSEEGQITAPIFGRTSKPIGQVTFNYLVIRPMQNDILDMSRARSYHWNTDSKSVDVGHRGMGTSYKLHLSERRPIPHIRENTLRSLIDAGHCGADIVEFDVQLTRDQVPVIYHDFNLKVNLRKRVMDNMDDMKDANFELCTMAVKDLSIRQLQSLQTYHASVEESGTRDWRTDPTAANADEPNDLLPFPTLEKLLHSLDKGVGVDVEIKYPQFIDHGNDVFEHEQDHFFDRNTYLDKILETLLHHSGDRRVIISCFDSDACVMLRAKQNRFPVLFLTLGQTAKYPPYKDFRTLSIHAAIKFACAEQLMGINVNSEDLLREGSLVAETKHAGLVLFCWGEENNNQDNIQYLKSQGVDGIICDRINEFISDTKAAARNPHLRNVNANACDAPQDPSCVSSDIHVTPDINQTSSGNRRILNSESQQKRLSPLKDSQSKLTNPPIKAF